MSLINASCTVSKLIPFQPFPVSIRRLFFLRVSNPSYFKPKLIYSELIPAWVYLLPWKLDSIGGSSSHARPNEPWLSVLQSVFFPCVTPHCSLSAWSGRCCPSLCFGDPAKEHPRAAGYTGDRNKHKQRSWWSLRAEKALEAFLLQHQW